jgi:chloride channel 3/4/5
VGITKVFNDMLGKGGIADRMIWFNGFPFLDNKETHIFGVPVGDVMKKDLVIFPLSGTTIGQIGEIFGEILLILDEMLASTTVQGFPIVQNTNTNILLGYIGRTELKYARDRLKVARNVTADTQCSFGMSDSTDDNNYLLSPQASHDIDSPISPLAFSATVDFGNYIDSTPLTVHPDLPLETVMEIFKKLGPRVILIEFEGKLLGLVTIKDVLKYQFTLENDGTDRDGTDDQIYERLWAGLQHIYTSASSIVTKVIEVFNLRFKRRINNIELGNREI